MAKSVFIITAYQAPDDRPLSLQLDDRWFSLTANEPLEMESEFYAQKLIEIYGPVYGIVEIPTERKRTGISFNLDAAEKMAKTELDRIEMGMVENYVRDQRENRIRHNYPALPPSGRVAESIQRRQINLKQKYNLDVLGMESLSEDPEKAKLQQENADLRSRLDETDRKLDLLLEAAAKS